MKLFICEKPSQAKDIAHVLGVTTRTESCFEGKDVCVTWCVGHLLGLAPPDHYCDTLKPWRMAVLPIVPDSWTVLPQEKTKKQLTAIGKLLKKAKPLVNGKAFRPDNLIIGELETALEASQTLATVYRFKQQLRELWTNAGLSQEKRLEALCEWCRQAEETRIQCLEQFALTLRGYSVMQPK